MKILVAIPCYNEGLAIGTVALKAKRYVDEVLVMDDGSTDDTVEVAEAAGATVVAHEENKGKGRAVKNALQYAVEHDFDALVLLDGDGQHDLNEIPLATACAANKRCCGYCYWFQIIRPDACLQTGRPGGSGPCNWWSC